MIKDYVKIHSGDGRYSRINGQSAVSIFGWEDHFVSPYSILSHRCTNYTSSNFAERLHSHDFYELVVYLGGDVEYTNGDLVHTPDFSKLSVIINRPGEVHTTRLLRPGEYERYVLYFDRRFLEFFDGYLPFADFLDSLRDFALSFDEVSSGRMLSLLSDAVSSMKKSDRLSQQHAYTNLLSFFSLLCSQMPIGSNIKYIPENILMIKNYVDTHCVEIRNVNAIAGCFFYSREHVSRLFKKYFNINLADYLARKKCEESKLMLESGESVGNVYSKCGFGSLPSYVRAFRQFYRMTPAEFARLKRN